MGRGGEAPGAELGQGDVLGNFHVRINALFSWLSLASPGTLGLASGLHGCRLSRK